jgi:hypothetical protein
MPENKPVFLPWLRLWSREWLEGSLRFDCTAAERGIWADLLAMANQSRRRGIIQANPSTAYPHEWIADRLCIPLQELEESLVKFKKSGRIEENGTGITIINFSYYNPPSTGTGKVGRPPKHKDDSVESHDKYFKGEYGHMVRGRNSASEENKDNIEEDENDNRET